MNLLKEIEDWYLSCCDGEWEHGGGFKIENLDNPGWSVDCNLEYSIYENIYFQEIDQLKRSEHDWLLCHVENNIFKGVGGPKNLIEILEIFIEWVKGGKPWERYN